MHISYIDNSQWGRISANGLAIITDNQLIIIDTPWNDSQTQALVECFKNNYRIDEVKVIICHYHEDNLGGLNWVNNNNIESYSIKKTQEICGEKDLPIPRKTLKNTQRFDFNEIPIETVFREKVIL